MTHSIDDLKNLSYQQRQSLYQNQSSRSKQRRDGIKKRSQPVLSSRQAELQKIENRIAQRKAEGRGYGAYVAERDAIKQELANRQTLETNIAGESGWYLENYATQVEALQGRASVEQLEALEDARQVFLNKLGTDDAGRELVDELSSVMVEVKHAEAAEIAERSQSLADRQAALDVEQANLTADINQVQPVEPEQNTGGEPNE